MVSKDHNTIGWTHHGCKKNKMKKVQKGWRRRWAHWVMSPEPRATCRAPRKHEERGTARQSAPGSNSRTRLDSFDPRKLSPNARRPRKSVNKHGHSATVARRVNRWSQMFAWHRQPVYDPYRIECMCIILGVSFGVSPLRLQTA